MEASRFFLTIVDTDGVETTTQSTLSGTVDIPKATTIPGWYCYLNNIYIMDEQHVGFFFDIVNSNIWTSSRGFFLTYDDTEGETGNIFHFGTATSIEGDIGYGSASIPLLLKGRTLPLNKFGLLGQDSLENTSQTYSNLTGYITLPE